MTALLAVRDLSLVISLTDGRRARPVDGVSFEIAAGECFALLGESGCGKSLTALSILRLLPPAAMVATGEVGFEGRDLLRLAEHDMRSVRGGGIGMIFQEPATSLNPVLRIGQQIGEALALHEGLRGAAARQRTVELLSQVGIPDPAARFDAYPFQMSGGMKQRVMIAMALAGRPRLLIADEPTTALDVTIQAQVLEVLDDLRRQQGMALLLISHDLGVVARMADRVGVMYAGQLVETAPRETFFTAPAHPYTQRLFAALPDPRRRGGRLSTIPGSVPAAHEMHTGCRFAARCAEVMPACRSDPPPWHAMGADHFMRCVLGQGTAQESFPGTKKLPAGTRSAGGTAGALSLLEVRDLAVHFPIRRGLLQRAVGQVRAVDGVSLALAPGRTLALVGESGCGKTTVAKALLQLIAPTGGRVVLDGTELTRLPPGQLRPLRAKMQMVFQDPYASLDPRMTVGEIIGEGIEALRPAAWPRRAARVAGLLAQVGLQAEMASRYPHEFSGGQRQRIAIARALAVEPQLLICDEPTSALDVSVQAQILNLLSDLQARLGLAYLFITHNLGVVDYLADEVAVMYLGRIVERGTTDEVLRAPRHPYTQALLAAVPTIDGRGKAVVRLAGDMPSPANPPPGCHFHPRCPLADAACRARYPAAVEVSATHAVHCLKVVS
ncbi:MAG: ABC transporter ATP-binding protein [Betaproteobacteria bacterium HGW-Betaproteobacteria-11]|nr:MAG: ABC transporter ATP-binding protein [Betaproteobacteria bacterium HGW-Betaproteobacteria-11]